MKLKGERRVGRVGSASDEMMVEGLGVEVGAGEGRALVASGDSVGWGIAVGEGDKSGVSSAAEEAIGAESGVAEGVASSAISPELVATSGSPDVVDEGGSVSIAAEGVASSTA